MELFDSFCDDYNKETIIASHTWCIINIKVLIILVNLTKKEVFSFSNVECIISFVFLEYSPKGQLRNPAAVPTKTANPTFLQHNQSNNISYIVVNNKNIISKINLQST